MEKRILSSMRELYKITSSTKGVVIINQEEAFEYLKKEKDYWGNNTIFEMKDFCKRNNLNKFLPILKALEIPK